MSTLTINVVAMLAPAFGSGGVQGKWPAALQGGWQAQRTGERGCSGVWFEGFLEN